MQNRLRRRSMIGSVIRQMLMDRCPIGIGFCRRSTRFDPGLQRCRRQRFRWQAGCNKNLALDRIPKPKRGTIGASCLTASVGAQQVANDGNTVDHRGIDYDNTFNSDEATPLDVTRPAADAAALTDDATDCDAPA